MLPRRTGRRPGLEQCRVPLFKRKCHVMNLVEGIKNLVKKKCQEYHVQQDILHPRGRAGYIPCESNIPGPRPHSYPQFETERDQANRNYCLKTLKQIYDMLARQSWPTTAI